MGIGQSHLITSQKGLQRAYLTDGPEIKLMMGSSNYSCSGLFDGASCADKKAMYGRMCPPEDCSYKTAMAEAKAADITLHNFDSFLYQASLASLFEPRALICFDEAHDTEEHLVRAMEVVIKKEALQRAGLAWSLPKSDDQADVSKWLDVLAGSLETSTKMLAERINSIKDGRRKQGMYKEMSKFSRQIQSLDRLSMSIDRYLRSSVRTHWVAELDEESVRLEPVSGRKFANSALLQFGERRLFLSATIFNKGKPLINALGLDRDETAYFGIEKSFPVHTRPIVSMAVGDLSYHRYKASQSKVIKAVREIVDKHAGVRGVIHCTSYKLSDEIRDNIGSQRLVFHGNRDRDTVITGFLAGKYPSDAILVAVSVTQGYDFKYDLCRFQVVVKIPYLFPSKKIEERRKFDPDYYDWRTALTLVQTIGRGNRAADDHCTTYVLDSRLDGFISRKKKMLPNWFVEAISSKKKGKEDDEYDFG
jgi:Rad3-related DNA helicase